MSIKKYLPAYYDNVKDMQKIMETEDIELKLTLNTLEEVASAFFIRKTTPTTIQKWIQQFDVDLSGKTFEEQKRELLSLMLGFSKLSCSKIEQITLTKTTYRAISFIEGSKIVINFDDIGYPDEVGMQEVLDYIEQLKPAHLRVEIQLRFRTHKQLKNKTHKYLKKYTHKEIKERREAL
jgi:hypothetical protein